MSSEDTYYKKWRKENEESWNPQKKKRHWLRNTFFTLAGSAAIVAAVAFQDELKTSYNKVAPEAWKIGETKPEKKRYKVGDRVPVKIPDRKDDPTPN